MEFKIKTDIMELYNKDELVLTYYRGKNDHIILVLALIWTAKDYDTIEMAEEFILYTLNCFMETIEQQKLESIYIDLYSTRLKI